MYSALSVWVKRHLSLHVVYYSVIMVKKFNSVSVHLALDSI